MKPELLLFDCMETLIDMTVLPTEREYAQWAYDGCGYEHLWSGGFEEFRIRYGEAVKELGRELPEYKEYDMRDRYEHILKSLPDAEGRDRVADSLCSNYWKNYSLYCYVSDEVRHTLEQLADRYPLAVVSNFKVPGGVEDLLEAHGIGGLFRFVVTSIGFGWRKPHPAIYRHALELAGIGPEKAVFIGDDYSGDYEGPGRAGIRSVLYDPKNGYPGIKSRIVRMGELSNLL